METITYKINVILFGIKQAFELKLIKKVLTEVKAQGNQGLFPSIPLRPKMPFLPIDESSCWSLDRMQI